MLSRFAPMLLVLFTLSATGCSYLFMQAPPRQHARLDTFTCTDSRGWAFVDTGFALMHAAVVVAIAVLASTEGETGDLVLAIPSTATVGVATASAIYGFSTASECDDAYDRLADRQQQAREPRDAGTRRAPPAAEIVAKPWTD